MPLLPNGKIDRKALHQVESVQPRQYQAPETPTEVALAEMWTEVLKLDRVGISDDFFEVGGNSLSATRLVARINRAFDTSIPVRKVFERKTVADLALLIEETIIAEYLRPGE
jgi:acyl carrier protein